MGRTFTRINLASTGDFPPNKNDKIKGWVEHNGGTFSKEIDATVTHLVASPRAWKNYVPMVKEARRLRTIHIVRLEWLEDSLLSKSRRPLDTQKYQYERRKMLKKSRPRNSPQQAKEPAQDSSDESSARLREVSSRKDKLKNLKAKKEGTLRGEGLTKSEKLEISANYRPFVDSMGFVYLLTLVRKDKLRDRVEKHRVKVRFAPYCVSEHQTSYEISHQNPHPRRANSDPDIRLGCDRPIPPVEDQQLPRLGVKVEVGSAKPCLPMCPVPLYYFPKPYPYSAYPVVAGHVPPTLSMSNPHLRVRIPDPWAQGLQLFEYQEPNDATGSKANPKRTKEYACYTIYSRPGHRHVETLAPPGSTFDFAWNMFQKMFKQKVGVDWEARKISGAKPSEETDAESWTEGGDGGDGDRSWDYFGPLRLKQPTQVSLNEDGGMDGEMESEPSAMVVVNTATREPKWAMRVGVHAKTPENGW